MFRKLSMSPLSCVNPSTRNSHFEPARYFLNIFNFHEYLLLVSFVFVFGLIVSNSFCLCMQLEDGDIVCFQKPNPVENGPQFRYPDVPSFLDFVHNRLVNLSKLLYTCWELLFYVSLVLYLHWLLRDTRLLMLL